VNPYPKIKRVVDKGMITWVRDRDGYCIAGRELREQCLQGIDVHHIHSRGSGGGDIKENLICLCRKHHNMAHNGLITRKQLEAMLERRYGYKYEM
jgi:hypothetical protein